MAGIATLLFLQRVEQLLNFIISNIFLPLILGGFSWIILNLVINPWLKVDEIRTEIYENLIFYSNIYTQLETLDQSHKEIWELERSKFRNLSVRLSAIQTSFLFSGFWHKWLNQLWIKYDLKEATSSLMGLHNSFYSTEAISSASKVKTAFRLPI
jgi:hypothetical protein